MSSISAPEILLILAAVILLFGAKKLPDFARSLGKAKTEFKKGLEDGGSDSADESETDKS